MKWDKGINAFVKKVVTEMTQEEYDALPSMADILGPTPKANVAFANYPKQSPLMAFLSTHSPDSAFDWLEERMTDRQRARNQMQISLGIKNFIQREETMVKQILIEQVENGWVITAHLVGQDQDLYYVANTNKRVTAVVKGLMNLKDVPEPEVYTEVVTAEGAELQPVKADVSCGTSE